MQILVKKLTRQKFKKKKKKSSSGNQKIESLAVEPSESLLEESETVRDEKESIETDVEEGIQHPAKLSSSESTGTLERNSFQLVSSATERSQDIQENASVAQEQSVGTKGNDSLNPAHSVCEQALRISNEREVKKLFLPIFLCTTCTLTMLCKMYRRSGERSGP